MSAPDSRSVIDADLSAALEEISRAPHLLVASDFDGTISPVVSDPALAAADPASVAALRALAAMPCTHVSIISGRALSELARLTHEIEPAHLVGSHGGEFSLDFSVPLSPEATALRERILTRLREIAAADKDFLIEEKPASLAFHYRNVSERMGQTALEAVLTGPASWPGVHVRHGKKVIELSVIEAGKGHALGRVRQRAGATAALFLGDDVTDEEAFLTLSGPDVGVKVGPGDTAARYRVADTTVVARLLGRLAEMRREWLAGSGATPIEQHSLLSDQRTIALVDPRGRLVWMCLPRIDSSATFAELLGGPTAGYFEVAPRTVPGTSTQRYLGDTFVLETKWPEVKVTDYLDCGGGRAFQRAGRTDLIRVIEGKGPMRVVFAPRLDFGRNETRLIQTQDGVAVDGAVDSLVLRAPTLPWRLETEGRHQSAIAEFNLGSEPVVLEMRYGTASLEPSPQNEPTRRERTERFWSGWASTLTLPPVMKAQVLRSALVLKALTYGPTGAIAAAATTSLPELIGGVRNWDYRFCWPRDAAMAGAALLRLGAPGPGIKLLDWVLGILDQHEPGALISPLYTVAGGHIGPEGEIGDLSGYRGSRPVRVGNAAAHQIQLDVFGPVADLVALLAEHGAALSGEHWRLVDAMTSSVERRWRDPDHGIWEVRRPRRHHVHSKVMCWQAVDRAIRVARYVGRKRPEWLELREEIASDLLTHGWNEKEKAFCATYHGDEPDASSLCVGLSGLIPHDDPRFVSTVEYVERHLRHGPTVYRYVYDDGIPGGEAGFNLCTAWLIEAYAMIGRRRDAEDLFTDFLRQCGPTGLLAEEFDPDENTALGNYPQAYSHVGLINAAICLSAANKQG